MTQVSTRHPRAKRIAKVSLLSSLIGGVIAAVSLIALHAYPIDVLPAAPVYWLCLLGGGGDWGALLFIVAGGFALYAAYGAALSFATAGRPRALVACVILVLHAAAAVLCELRRQGKL